MREEILLTDGIIDTVTKMAEGNPGAILILLKVLASSLGIFGVLHLDDMNIRGTQIQVAWKDWADADEAKFLEAIRTRDPAMIQAVNEVGMRGNHNDRAVPYGAGGGHREMLRQAEAE